MPRLLNRNPKYRKHRASGQAVVTIDGKDCYLGPWNTKASRAEYDRLIGEWLAGGRHLALPASDLTVSELIERYMTFAVGYYRLPDGTPSSEMKSLNRPLAVLRRLYGHTLARDFGPLALDAMRGEMIRLGWCRTKINHHAGRIRRAFKWAASKEIIPASVFHALSSLSGLRAGRSEARESEPVRPVDDAVVDATLPHLSSVIGAMVQLQRLTGARGGEVCGIRTADIETSGPVWIFSPPMHKTAHHGHRRQIFIGPKAQEVLRPFLKPLNAMAYIFSPADAMAEERQRRAEARKTTLSCGNVTGSNCARNPKRQPGNKYSSSVYCRAIARACEAAGVPHWHPHQLRHGAATAIRRQFGIEAAQHVLGHATLNMTELYAEKNAEAGQRIAAAIG